MSMMVIRMPQQKVDDLAVHIENGLRCIGKAMQCIDEMQHQPEMGERNDMGYRNGGWERYPMEMGSRYPDYDEMGERRGVRGTGRYSRF